MTKLFNLVKAIYYYLESSYKMQKVRRLWPDPQKLYHCELEGIR